MGLHFELFLLRCRGTAVGTKHGQLHRPRERVVFRISRANPAHTSYLA